LSFSSPILRIITVCKGLYSMLPTSSSTDCDLQTKTKHWFCFVLISWLFRSLTHIVTDCSISLTPHAHIAMKEIRIVVHLWKLKYLHLQKGAHGSIVVKALMLQTGRSRVWDLMRWMIFINLPNPSGHASPWGLLSL
jgi:hypothetical protein